MNNEKELFDLYIDRGNARCVLRHPFLQDGKVYATDGHVMICVGRDLCDGEYSERPEGLQPPNTSSVIPEPDTDEPLTRRMLEKAMKRAPEENACECPECKGGGLVRWEYKDRLYEKHWKIDECPVCSGSGCIDSYTPVTTQFSIHDAYLCYHHLEVLKQTMNLLQVKTLRLLHVSNSEKFAFLFGVDGKDIRIVVMPQMRNDGLDKVRII